MTVQRRFELGELAATGLLGDQDGVVARRQLLKAGATPNDVARMLRRRELTCAHPGVYITHTGPLTPRQREWVAVLTAWPAALDAANALGIRRSSTAVQVAVEHGRSLVLPPWVSMRRSHDLGRRAQWQRLPPRLRTEEALIDEMARRLRNGAVHEAFALLAEVVTARKTTPERVLATLQRRTRIGNRRLIEQMLTDARDGQCSVLERGYRQIERAHGLPRGVRQQRSRATGGLTLQDVRYLEHRLVVELDGTLGHASAAGRDADALRDLAELAQADLVTARLTYGLVFRLGCTTAWHGAGILRSRGWAGSITRCPNCPTAPPEALPVDSVAPGASTGHTKPVGRWWRRSRVGGMVAASFGPWLWQ